MGIAKQYNKRLHSEIGAYAAWLPMANQFELGDFGLISQGFFQRLGNIREFGVQVTGREGKPVELDYRSDGTRVVSVAGGVEVDMLPAAPIAARLRIEFRDREAYYLKASRSTVEEIPNLHEVAAKLANAPGWRKKYRVVWTTITGHDCIIATSTASSASLVLGGQADALLQVGVGAIGADVQVVSEEDVGIRVVGQTGVVGLKLFKLKVWSSDAKFLPAEDQPEGQLLDKDPAPDDDV
ncbi:hypothetical protein [Geodermatophilus sp. URMC 62]|uniref:hypothetical protein n=1 Tax=Geodermatophilus sp. URMC 62 TaxID=3423414 RepID=UPI00406C707B